MWALFGPGIIAVVGYALFLFYKLIFWDIPRKGWEYAVARRSQLTQDVVISLLVGGGAGGCASMLVVNAVLGPEGVKVDSHPWVYVGTAAAGGVWGAFAFFRWRIAKRVEAAAPNSGR